jgi:hypothetical protein
MLKNNVLSRLIEGKVMRDYIEDADDWTGNKVCSHCVRYYGVSSRASLQYKLEGWVEFDDESRLAMLKTLRKLRLAHDSKIAQTRLDIHAKRVTVAGLMTPAMYGNLSRVLYVAKDMPASFTLPELRERMSTEMGWTNVTRTTKLACDLDLIHTRKEKRNGKLIPIALSVQSIKAIE